MAIDRMTESAAVKRLRKQLHDDRVDSREQPGIKIATLELRIELTDEQLANATRHYRVATMADADEDAVMNWLRRLAKLEAERLIETICRDGIGPPIGSTCAKCKGMITLFEVHQRTVVVRDGLPYHRWCAISRENS